MGRVCLCGEVAGEAPAVDLLGLKGIHLSGNKATRAANPSGHGEATLRVWAVRLDGWVGFCSGELAAPPAAVSCL